MGFVATFRAAFRSINLWIAIGMWFAAVAVHSRELATHAPPSAKSYAIDQSLYFPTPEIEQAEFKQRIEESITFPVVAPVEPMALSNYLHRAEMLLAQLQRHSAYLYLRASRDLDDREDADASDRADDAMQSVMATVWSALSTLGNAEFTKASSVDPSLRKYGYVLKRAEQELPHKLPIDQQAVLDEIADPAAANLWSLYQRTMRSTPFPKVDTSNGQFDVKKDARLLNANPDRAIRRTAWEGRMNGYASRADIYAGILLGVVRLNDRIARLKHFPDAPSSAYFSKSLNRTEVAEALVTIKSYAKVQKDYQSMLARHFSAVTGITDVHIWDMPLPEAGLPLPQMTFDQTRTEALAALAPLGVTYVERFRQLLDPVNGRLDVGADQGKRTNGSFSIRAPGVHTGLFVENYGAGLLGESRTVIHEGGHAIHEELMNDSGVSPFYTRGPNWMFEAFATLNEFLLYDHLYQTAKDPRAKAYFLRALIDDMTFGVFGSAEDTTLEQSLYDGVVAGKIKNAADIDALTTAIWREYEIWPASDPQLAHHWITRPLMIQDPLYQVNYLYAGTLAIKMFDMAMHDPAFQRRYMDLLQEGFHASSAELLNKFFRRDLSQHELIDDDMKIIDQEIRVLGGIYNHLDNRFHGDIDNSK
jgi:oligoendopeptidase F